jgi:hypothetical protein
MFYPVTLLEAPIIANGRFLFPRHHFILATLLDVLNVEEISDSRDYEFLEALSSDLYELAFESNVEPIRDPYFTLGLMISTLYSETRLRRLGIHDPKNPNWCLMQINLGVDKSGRSRFKVVYEDRSGYAVSKTTGFDGSDLERDQKVCLRVGLEYMRESWRMCQKYPENERLSTYLSGSCFKSRRASRFRFRRAQLITSMLEKMEKSEILTRQTQVCYNNK